MAGFKSEGPLRGVAVCCAVARHKVCVGCFHVDQHMAIIAANCNNVPKLWVCPSRLYGARRRDGWIAVLISTHLGDGVWAIPAICRLPNGVPASTVMHGQLGCARAGQQSLLVNIIGGKSKAVHFRNSTRYSTHAIHPNWRWNALQGTGCDRSRGRSHQYIRGQLQHIATD